jgi:hypothetical protein
VSTQKVTSQEAKISLGSQESENGGKDGELPFI